MNENNHYISSFKYCKLGFFCVSVISSFPVMAINDTVLIKLSSSKFDQITKGKITFFIEVSEIKNNGSRIYGGACCQGINGSQCSVLCKPLLTISLRYVLIL